MYVSIFSNPFPCTQTVDDNIKSILKRADHFNAYQFTQHNLDLLLPKKTDGYPREQPAVRLFLSVFLSTGEQATHTQTALTCNLNSFLGRPTGPYFLLCLKGPFAAFFICIKLVIIMTVGPLTNCSFCIRVVRYFVSLIIRNTIMAPLNIMVKQMSFFIHYILCSYQLNCKEGTGY